MDSMSNHQSLRTTPPDTKNNPVIALGQHAEPLVQRSIIRKVLAGFEKHGWPLNTSERKKQRALQEEMVEHTHLLVQLEAVRYRQNRVFLNTLHHLSQPEEEDTFCRPIVWSIRGKDIFFSTMALNRANLVATPLLAVIFCSIVADELMARLKPSVSFARDTKEGDNTPYCINIPVKRQASSDRLQTRLEIHVEEHRRKTLEELSTPVVKDDEFWEKCHCNPDSQNGTLPKELQKQGKTHGKAPKASRREKKSFKAWLSNLFRQK